MLDENFRPVMQYLSNELFPLILRIAAALPEQHAVLGTVDVWFVCKDSSMSISRTSGGFDPARESLASLFRGSTPR